MVGTIQKWGNSQGIRIPKMLLESLGIRENDRVELAASEDCITIKKIQSMKHRTLEERLTSFYGKPVEEIATVCGGEEVDWGSPKGEEAW